MDNSRILSLKKILLLDQFKLLAIDADDTVWYDSRYFRRLENYLVNLSYNYGVDRETTLNLVKKVRKEHLSGEHGFTSIIKDVAMINNLSHDDMGKLYNKIDIFLNHPTELLAYVKDSLEILTSFKKILLTKGQVSEQWKKLSNSGISEYFDEVIILSKKGKKQFSEFLLSQKILGEETIVIGNSVKHDIIPAIENNACAIWINHNENLIGRNADIPNETIEIESWEQIKTALTLS